VNLSYANVDKDSYLSVTGTARVIEDMAKKKNLYGPLAKAWFPDGPEDPELELIEVTIDEAEYWDVKQSKLRQIFTMAKAAATGHPPKNMADHGEVRLN
jgi:general stress protein 26